jgi:hypothetical protein
MLDDMLFNMSSILWISGYNDMFHLYKLLKDMAAKNGNVTHCVDFYGPWPIVAKQGVLLAI